MKNNILQNWGWVQRDPDSKNTEKLRRPMTTMLYVVSARAFVIKAQQKQFCKRLGEIESSLSTRVGAGKESEEWEDKQ